jgi:hypothetical protein
MIRILNRFDSHLNTGIRSLIYLECNDICICEIFELCLVLRPVCSKLLVTDMVESEISLSSELTVSDIKVSDPKVFVM